MSEFFSVLSNVLMLAVVAIYFQQVRRGVSTPNPSTWILWVIVSAMNAITYFFVTEGNLWQSFITITVTGGLGIILLYSWWRGKFSRLGTLEIVCFLIAILVGIFWKVTGNAVWANLALQLVFLISFVPTGYGLLKHQIKEKPLPWNIAVVGYTCMIGSIVWSEEWSWVALAHPIANGIIGNGTIAVIITLHSGKQKPAST